MAGRIAVDTTFLIDLQRERARGNLDGPAHRFLDADPDLELFLSTVALGEFAEGFETDDHPVLRAVRELHVPLEIDEPTALHYGRIARELRSKGLLIGTNDLWIAASSIRHGLPLVAANPRHFNRVHGLEAATYR